MLDRKRVSLPEEERRNCRGNRGTEECLQVLLAAP